ncbi:hypothetical protein SAMN05444672_1724 [Bacillus sp. OK838]|nr:hypothetical protein SAMN05444672_1724 [Bacillus sp. OK838]
MKICLPIQFVITFSYVGIWLLSIMLYPGNSLIIMYDDDLNWRVNGVWEFKYCFHLLSTH